MRKLLTLLLVLATTTLVAQDYDYKFRLTLEDKGETRYSVDKPHEFLSKKAIERRKKQHIEVNENDLPISDTYIKAIEDAGGIVVAKSKWLGTVAVHCEDSAMVETFKALSFVKDAKFVWKGKRTIEMPDEDQLMHAMVIKPQPEEGIERKVYEDYYGFAETNIKIENGHYLHQAGYKGKGMDIAVIDAGFSNLHRITYLDNINIVESKGFVYQGGSNFVTDSQHGLNVLSCMATNQPNFFVGTAPEANYFLLTSEDSVSEFPIEEDYWATAIEYADSLGVDVVNTSLGYTRFDAPAVSMVLSQLDGKTSMISRASDMAVRKGMFVVCSAGNSGKSEWGKLTPPGDAFLTLTVGAIQKDSLITDFSSRGFTTDLRIKPEVVALGRGAAVIGNDGVEATKNGTSFSTPITTGLVACLWQAYPTLTNRELYQVIIESADKIGYPDSAYGYGLPDMKKAMQLAKDIADRKAKKKN